MKIIVDLAGGFGNQLFCYCFGYALSKEKNGEFIIDTSMQDNGIARELELLNLRVVYDRRISYRYDRNIVSRAIINKVVKRNAIGAGNALIAADMALAGCTSVIPADECIDAMKKVGHQMPVSIRETALGG